MRRSWAIAVLAAAALLLAAAFYLAGWFQPVLFPDSYGYLRAGGSAEPWSQERHPLYGWLALSLETLEPGHATVPALQYGLQVAAAFALYAACRRVGLPRSAALALGLSALFSQGLVIWGRAVLPESPSASMLLLSIAAAIEASRGRGLLLLAPFAAGALALACVLRPIMAPALLLVPLLCLLFARMQGEGWRWRRCLTILALAVLPLFAQAAHRWQKVGDFGIVSYAGFGVSGMTVQLLTPDVLDRVAEAQRPLAQQMLEAKERAVAEQLAMPLYRNSVGERSFQATALDGFDTLARNFDGIMWGKLSKIQGSEESWVAFNARMGAANAAILRALPERWILWVAGATSRLVGRLIVYNVAFLIASLIFAGVALLNIARHGRVLGGGAGAGWTKLALIIAVWVISTTALSVVTAFPALRYTDTGGMLVTALPLYGLMLALRKTKDDAPA
jgi:hypothetical protein